MEDSYVRCQVILQITKVLWPQKDSCTLHLKGDFVFLQVCLLGQLQQTDLFPPMFPIEVNSTLTFDRIFTNCKLPSLLPEVLRGEHIKIELIQVNEDRNGGKVLGRYETRSDSFLYSETTGCGPFQLIMERSHHYDTPPLLQVSCCMSILEAVVKSPLKIISQPFSSNHTKPLQYNNNENSVIDKSHDLSHDQTRKSQNDHSVHWQLGETFDQSNHSNKSHDQTRSPFMLQETPSEEVLQRSELIQRLRKSRDQAHEYSTCHERSHNKSHDLSHDSVMYSDHSWEECPRRHCNNKKSQASNQITSSPTKPFVVPRPDPTLLSKRDFCSSSPYKSKTRPPMFSTPLSSFIQRPSFISTQGGQDERDAMFAKYLPPSRQQQYMYQGAGGVASSTCRQVQDKLQDLMKDLHGDQKDSYCVHEEDHTAADDLRTSFARERDESVLPSSFYVPNDSLLTRIASHDYWSTKAAQYTGKPHRLIFDETLEKIYGRLYRNS